MPLRYEDRTTNDLLRLAKRRKLKHVTPISRKNLIALIRFPRVVSPPKHGYKRSPQRVQRYERCVKTLSRKRSVINPYAVCNVSVYGSRRRTTK